MKGGRRVPTDEIGQAWFPFSEDSPEEDTDVARRWNFTFIDLFAGIGGFRIALEGLGGRCVFSCEIDDHARRTYSQWFGEDPQDTKRFAKDIRQVENDSPDCIRIPKHDLLAAGFPCQPFSLAGVSKKNSLGRPHGFACQEQGNLFLDIIRIAERRKSPALLLENVKYLLRHDRGRTWNRITCELSAAGYVVLHQVIDARYWVPQHRERIFIAAFRKDMLPPAVLRDLERRQGSPEPFRIRPPRKAPVLADILEENPDAKYTLSPRLWQYLQAYRAKHERLGNGFGFGLVDPRIDTVTRTLSARYHKDGSEILIGRKGPHGEPMPDHRPRRLTPVECARLMGFSEKVENRNDIPVSDTQAYRQFGNALVPAVARAVARFVLEKLENAGLVSQADTNTKTHPDSRTAPTRPAPGRDSVPAR